MSKVGCIIQARMTSTRLPGKVLKKIGNVTVLEHMIKRVQSSHKSDLIIVATTINKTDDKIVSLCKRLGVEIFRGDEYDVLGRYYEAAKKFDIEVVVRLTSDCPMIDPSMIDQMIDFFFQNNYDYVSNTIERSYPDGLDIEIFSFDSLKKANKNAIERESREHVTLYLNAKKPHLKNGNFTIGQLKWPKDFSQIRITLDTIEDLILINNVYKNLPKNYRWSDILKLIENNESLFDPSLN